MNALEVTVIGFAWVFVTVGTVTPLECYMHPTGRVMRLFFGSEFVLCIAFSLSSVAMGGAILGGWWAARRYVPRVRAWL